MALGGHLWQNYLSSRCTISQNKMVVWWLVRRLFGLRSNSPLLVSLWTINLLVHFLASIKGAHFKNPHRFCKMNKWILYQLLWPPFKHCQITKIEVTLLPLLLLIFHLLWKFVWAIHVQCPPCWLPDYLEDNVCTQGVWTRIVRLKNIHPPNEETGKSDSFSRGLIRVWFGSRWMKTSICK